MQELEERLYACVGLCHSVPVAAFHVRPECERDRRIPIHHRAATTAHTAGTQFGPPRFSHEHVDELRQEAAARGSRSDRPGVRLDHQVIREGVFDGPVLCECERAFGSRRFVNR